MLACILPFFTSSATTAPSVKQRPGTPGTLNGRVPSVAPSAPPRVSCQSSWWDALKYGGIKGLFHWNVRKKQDSKLPRVQREQQKGNAKTDLESSLKKNFSADVAGAKEEYQSKLQASLENALWYGVDVEKLVKNVFSEAPRTRRGFMQEACRGVKSLPVIVGYLADGNATYQGLESQLRSR